MSHSSAVDLGGGAGFTRKTARNYGGGWGRRFWAIATALVGKVESGERDRGKYQKSWSYRDRLACLADSLAYFGLAFAFAVLALASAPSLMLLLLWLVILPVVVALVGIKQQDLVLDCSVVPASLTTAVAILIQNYNTKINFVTTCLLPIPISWQCWLILPMKPRPYAYFTISSTSHHRYFCQLSKHNNARLHQDQRHCCTNTEPAKMRSKQQWMLPPTSTTTITLTSAGITNTNSYPVAFIPQLTDVPQPVYSSQLQF